MKRVLLLRLSAMGDLVQSLGAMSALARARPDLELHMVTQRPFVPLLQGLPWLASVVAHDRAAGWRGLWQTGRALARLGADVALDLQGNGKSAVLAWLSRCRVRIGAGAAWRQEPWSRWLLSRTVAGSGPRHPAAVALAVVRVLAPEAMSTSPRLLAEAEEIDREAAAVLALGIDPALPFRVLLLGDPDDCRSQRPAAMQLELASSPWPTLLLAGPREAAVAAPAEAPVLRHDRGQVRRLLALGALLERAGGDVVGGDGGALHVLAAAGASCRALFGPQDPACTASLAVAVLQHPHRPACMPCRRRRCTHPEGPVCMDFASRDGAPWRGSV